MTLCFSSDLLRSRALLAAALLLGVLTNSLSAQSSEYGGEITPNDALYLAGQTPLMNCRNRCNCEVACSGNPQRSLDSDIPTPEGTCPTGGCGAQCGVTSLPRRRTPPSAGLTCDSEVPSTVGYGANGPSALSNSSFEEASIVYNYGANYMHWADDIRAKGFGTRLRRVHRPRHIAIRSSFGPGVFSNFDIEVVGESDQNSISYMDFVVRDPMAPVPYAMYAAGPTQDEHGNQLERPGLKNCDIAGQAVSIQMGPEGQADNGVSRDPAGVTVSDFYLAGGGYDEGALKALNGDEYVFEFVRIPQREIWDELLGYQAEDPANVYPGFTEGRYGPGGDFNEKLVGRLKKIKNAHGEYVIEYKEPSVQDVFDSFDRVFEYEKITGPDGTELSFQYDNQGRVTQVSSSNGQITDYEYFNNDGFLTAVIYNDGSSSTFSHSGDANSGLAAIEIHDVRAFEGHRKKTVYVTAIAANSPWHSNQFYYNGAVNMVRVITNGDDEVIYANFGMDVQGESQSAYIYEGGGAAKVFREFNSITGGLTARIISELESDWHIDVLGGGAEFHGDEKVLYYFKYNSNGSMIGSTPYYVKDKQQSVFYEYLGGWSSRALYSDGTFEAWHRNDDGQVLRHRDREGRVKKYEYNGDGVMTKMMVGIIENPNTNQDPYSSTTYDPDPDDDVLTAEYAEYKWEHDGLNFVTKYIDGRGAETVYIYDNFHVEEVLVPSNQLGGTSHSYGFTYHPNGCLETASDPQGNGIEYFYDARQRLISQLYDDGTTERFFYVATGDGEGRLEKSVDRLGTITKFTYDASGRMIKRESAWGTMDGSGNETETPDIAKTETWTYLVGTRLPAEYRSDGALTTYEYDNQLNRSKVTVHADNGSTLVSQQFYEAGMLICSEDPYGRKTYYSYNADGRLARTVVGTVPEVSIASDPNDPYAGIDQAARSTSANSTTLITEHVYSPAGDLAQTFDPRNVETAYTYDSRARRISTLAAVGTPIETEAQTIYDLDSNVVIVKSPRYFDAGDTLGFQQAIQGWTYAPSGVRLTHSDAATVSESYVYDSVGRVVERIDFAGKSWKTHYEDCCGQVTVSENPLGDGSLVRTDALGRTVHQVAFEDYSSHVAALDNPVNSKTYSEVTTKYDALNRPVARTRWLTPLGTVDINNPPIAGYGGASALDGITEQFLYDSNLTDDSGLDSSVGASPLIGSASVSLSAALTKLAETPGNGGAGVTFNSDAPGNARVTINGEGEIRFSISDSAGRSVMNGVLDPADNSLLTWNCAVHDNTEVVAGYGTVLVAESVNANGHSRKSLADGAGRTIQQIDALGKITAYTYDAAGNQLSVRDPNNVGQDCLYDELSRDIQCTDTSGDAISSTYDSAGNKITLTDAKNEVTSYTYDARGRQIKQTDRLGGETEFAYSATGQLISLTDAEDQVTSYTYNDAGQKLTETYPDHSNGTTPGNSGYGIVTFTPDPAGRIVRKEDQLGDTVTYNYDLAGRLTSRDYRPAASSPSGGIADSDTFTYDMASRMLTAVSGRYSNTVTYTYDDAGRKTTEALTIDGVSYTTSTDYDDAGQVSKLTYPDGTEVDRTYTDRGQLATIALDSTTVDTRTYDDGGRMLTSTYNNGVAETRAYNNDNTLDSISYTGAAIGNLSYGWDDNKNKTSEGITGTMSGYGFDVGTSGYDDEDRLINWERDDSNLDQSWSLSLVGDWDSVTENSNTQTRVHGSAHEIVSAASQTVSHDAKGNMTVIPAILRPGSDPLNLTWDFDNRLSSADVDNDSVADVTYTWDALGRRVGRDDGTTDSVYVQSGQQTIADYTSGTAATSPTYTYVYASYIDEPVVRDGTGGLRYYHRTQQYSINALTDSSGTIKERYAYNAYGGLSVFDGSGSARTVTAEANRYTYTGREWDEELGLYHFRARMYDALCGRFLSRDPIGYADGESLYKFAQSNPLNLVDPVGTTSFWPGGGTLLQKFSDPDLPPGSPRTIFTPWIYPLVHAFCPKKEAPGVCRCNAISRNNGATRNTPTPVPSAGGGRECRYTITGTVNMSCSPECFSHCPANSQPAGNSSYTGTYTADVVIPARGRGCPAARRILNALPPSALENPPRGFEVEILRPDGTIIGELPSGNGAIGSTFTPLGTPAGQHPLCSSPTAWDIYDHVF